MADWYDDIVDEWRTLILATLPEIAPTNYFTVVESLRRNIISDAIKAIGGDTKKLAPPYIIQQIGKESLPRDRPVASRMYDIPTAIWAVVHETPSGDLTTLKPSAYARSLLERTRVAMQEAANLTLCQWMGDDGEIDSSEDVAFADEKMTLYAAGLTFANGFRTRIT